MLPSLGNDRMSLIIHVLTSRFHSRSKKLLMTPITITGECVPKDIKGSGAYTEPGQPARFGKLVLMGVLSRL